MKPVGSVVTIRLRWEGPADQFPAVGDWLRTPTGRTYEIESARGASLTCRVLPPGSLPDSGRVYDFYWLPRKRQ